MKARLGKVRSALTRGSGAIAPVVAPAVAALVPAAALIMLLAVGPVQAQENTTPELKALNHSRFVSSTIAACQEACVARSGPFEGQNGPAEDCDRTCACVGDQLGARITGDDLWSMFQAEQGGASRAEAMAPYVATMTMGYRACGFALP